jgi:uncharacterized protein (TIGR03067 family)
MLFWVALSLAAAPASYAGDAATEASTREKLAGVWDGQVDKGATGHTITITKDLISGTKDQTRDLGKGSYTLNLANQPWQMDATTINKDGSEGAVWLGTFKLEGDSLIWCVSKAARPTKFETSAGQFMLVLKRQSGEQANAAPAKP